jgi:hypothetical protein
MPWVIATKRRKPLRRTALALANPFRSHSFVMHQKCKPEHGCDPI